MSDSKKKTPDLRLSLEMEGNRPSKGENVFRLLEGVLRHGSISRAAEKLGVSYRYAWGLLGEAEKALGVSLMDRTVGGAYGGGAALTEEGKKLLEQSLSLEREIEEKLGRIFPSTKESDIIAKGQPILIASSLEPVETGLMDVLEKQFFKDTGIIVKTIGVGSGRALEMGREGRADLALCHAPELERQFVEAGDIFKRIRVMGNHYLIVGPVDGEDFSETGGDPVGIFQEIARKGLEFVSRDDFSGTHLKEQDLWQRAGLVPEDNRYLKNRGLLGNLGILKMAANAGAYTLIDRATYLISGEEGRMGIKSAPHPLLENPFSLILFRGGHRRGAYQEEALEFLDWIMSEGAQALIGHFGIDQFRESLFKRLY